MRRTIALITAVASAVAFGGNVCTWSGASASAPDDWSDADNWDVKPVGGNGDTIVIPLGKTVHLDASSSAARAIVEGGFEEIKMIGRIGEAANPGKLVVMVGAEDSPLTLNGKILGYRYGASDANSDASSGLVVKKGVGALRLKATLGDKDLYTNFIVEQGDLYLPQDVSSDSYYHDVCISNGATLHVAATTGTKRANHIYRLTGEGTVTNSHANGYTDIQLHVEGPCEFGGKLTNIRLFSKGGKLTLTGTNSTMTSYVSVRDNNGGGFNGNGMLSFVSIGKKGEPSSIGKADGFTYAQSGGVFIYNGTGETTDKSLRWQYPKTQKTFLSGGLHGGLVFGADSAWNIAYTSGAANNGMASLVLSVDNPTNACVMAGSIASSLDASGNTNRLYITKTGVGIWRFADHATRNGVGGIAVEEGTIQFDTLAEKGVMCALGTAEDSQSDYYGEYDASKNEGYAFSAGSATTEGTFEYTGSTPVWVTQRPMVLNGDVRFKNDGNAAFRYANVTPKTAGAKTVTLDGAGTGENVLADIFDSDSAPVSIVKEGSGTWTLANTNALHGAITVKGGTLKLQSPAGKYSWFLWTAKGVVYPDGGEGSDYKPSSMGQVYAFSLYRTNDYMCVNNGLSACSDYAAIQSGQAAYFDSKVHTGTLTRLFDGNQATTWSGTVDSKMPRVEDESSWVRIVMRLAADAGEVAGYDFGCTYGVSQSGLDGRYDMFGGDPGAWTLEGSVDGIHWHELHRIDNALDRNCGMPVGLYSKRLYKTQSGTAALILCSTNSQQIVGHSTNAANPLSEVASVSVVSNATLEVVGEALEIGNLVVDVTSGGTLRNFTFAQNGTLEVSEKGSGIVELPLAFEDCSEVNRISRWALSVADGKPTTRRIAVINGKVCIVPRGYVVSFR